MFAFITAQEKLKTFQWSFKDPSTLKGTEEGKLKSIEVIRNEIKKKMQDYINFFNFSPNINYFQIFVNPLITIIFNVLFNYYKFTQ